MYKTPDLYLASYLKASGIKIVSFHRAGKQVFFEFEDTDEVQKKCMDFLNDGQVSVNKYKNALQDLKDIIFHGGN
jgi:nucleoside-triphosphatase THEP1